MSEYRIFDTQHDAERAIDAAADAIDAGEVIVLPTDTVYGVGADPFDPAAVQRLLDAKQRGRDMPPPVLVADTAAARVLLADFDERAEAIAEAFWPGALTLVGRAASSLRMDLGDRGDTIAVRVPDHAFTRELLRQVGPLAVSSANLSGRDAAMTIAEATEQLGDAVSVYLDAGDASAPVPSTIVDFTSFEAAVLREGRISVEQLNAVVPGLIVPVVGDAASDGTPAHETSAADSPAADSPELGDDPLPAAASGGSEGEATEPTQRP